MWQIDRTVPVLVYQQIVTWIRQQIESGSWPEHYQLKSEIDLSAELGVSRGTLRKAISDLIDAGLLIRLHGKGTFVASRTLEQPLADNLISFSEDLIRKGLSFETRVLEQRLLRPPQEIASLLNLPANDEVFFLNRIRSVENLPIVALNNYVVAGRCRGIEAVDFTTSRLFEVLESQYGLDLSWGQRTFQAKMAGETLAQHLNLTPQDPVLYVEQAVYLRDDTPIEFSQIWFRGDSFRLSAVVDRKKGTEREQHIALDLAAQLSRKR
jgi:DNA-binding GntR family transcriptional regulator